MPRFLETIVESGVGEKIEVDTTMAFDPEGNFQVHKA